MAACTAASTCSAAVYKLAPFMKTAAPADNIYELLSPVWWVMDGKPISSYPLSTFWPQLANYARNNGKAATAGLIALCALMLLSLVFFLLWRFVRCVKVVCCQQEAYADANKVLFSKCLRVKKGLAIALGLLACGAAAWGMISLNKNLLPALNARIDSMQEFPAKIIQQVATLANETAALHQPLHNISSVINSIDAQGIRQDLQRVTEFLQEAPSPTALKTTLQQLSTALKPELYDGLRQLHSLINVAQDSSPLATLKGYLETLAKFDISVMPPAIRSYSTALTDLSRLIDSPRSDAEVQASREFARLRSSYDQLDLDAWVPYLDQAVATADAINTMRTPSTNPFTLTLKTLNGVEDTIKEIRGSLLPSLATTVEQFNGLWHNNASVAFQSLLIRAEHVNNTVLELPNDVEHKLLLVNSSVADFMRLYSGDDSLLNLPQQIQEAGGKLAMPDSSSFKAQAKAAEAQLNDAHALPELIAKLAMLARALDKTLRGAKSNIQPSLDAFASDESVRMDLADTLTFEAPLVAGAASLFESANLGGFKEYVSAVITRIDAAIEPAKRQADAIPGVLKQITDFDVIDRFMPPLQQAEAVYKQFNGNPAELTQPVFDMLDRVSSISSSNLADAQALVSNVSSSVQKMSDSIQAAAVDKVDSFQTAYLGKSANGTAAKADEGTAALVKAVHAVYYVMLGSYAVIIGLILVLMLMTLLNCPAGVCFGTVTLNTALVAFSAIPLIITIGLLLTRDVCGNLEALASKAVAQKAGNSSLPAAVSQFYLSSNPSNGSAGLPDIIKGVNAEYDVEGFKARVQQSVDDMLKGVTDDFSLRPQVSEVVNDATSRINSLLRGMDAVMLTLDHSNVAGVYSQGKSFFCCSLANQMYIQWVATIVVMALAWAAMQCAAFVLRSLDALSENCCRFRPYRSKDYGSGSGSRPSTGSILAAIKGKAGSGSRSPKRLQPMDSNSSETMAVISLGGTALQPSQLGQSAIQLGQSAIQLGQIVKPNAASRELPQCTPLPTPLTLRTVPPTSMLVSPRAAVSTPARFDLAAEVQRKQQQQQQHHAVRLASQDAHQQARPQLSTTQQQQQNRRSRVGESRPAAGISIPVYPAVVPAVPGSPSAMLQQREQQQQQQQWSSIPGGQPGKGLVRGPGGRV